MKNSVASMFAKNMEWMRAIHNLMDIDIDMLFSFEGVCVCMWGGGEGGGLRRVSTHPKQSSNTSNQIWFDSPQKLSKPHALNRLNSHVDNMNMVVKCADSDKLHWVSSHFDCNHPHLPADTLNNQQENSSCVATFRCHFRQTTVSCCLKGLSTRGNDGGRLDDSEEMKEAAVSADKILGWSRWTKMTVTVRNTVEHKNDHVRTWKIL